MLTYDEIRRDPEIRCYIEKADASVASLGYTEHSFAHVGVSADRCRYILETLGYEARTVELAQIAAWLHDIGRAEYVPVTDEEAVCAFEYLARTEGIIPAIESAHAVAHARKIAPEMSPDQVIVITISGRGDKDMENVQNYKENHR